MDSGRKVKYRKKIKKEDLEMKRLLLILVILVIGIFLTGCIVITAPDCCQPPITIECSVTVVSVSPDVYGEIIVNNKRTGEYFLPYQSYQSVTIGGIPCNEMAVIFIKDYCGYISDKKYVYIHGEDNYVIFYDWGPYGVKNGVKEQKDCQNDCHR